jgi:hypothetical protein
MVKHPKNNVVITHALDSDAIPRSIHQSLMVNSRFAVSVGPSGGIVGLFDNPDTHTRRLDCMFAFHYPDIITKPRLALLRSRYDLLAEQDVDHPSWDDTMKPIVGCTVSGGVVSIYRIDEPLYRLLSVLQERLLDYEYTKPLLGSPQNFKWYCGLSGAEKATIHGDVVESFLRLSIHEQQDVVQHTELNEAVQRCFGVQDVVGVLNRVLSSFEKY